MKKTLLALLIINPFLFGFSQAENKLAEEVQAFYSDVLSSLDGDYEHPTEKTDAISALLDMISQMSFAAMDAALGINVPPAEVAQLPEIAEPVIDHLATYRAFYDGFTPQQLASSLRASETKRLAEFLGLEPQSKELDNAELIINLLNEGN